MSEHIHIHKSSLDKDRNLILLFLPIIIFGIILAVYVFSVYSTNPENFSFNQSSVLGEKDTLDTKVQNIQK